LQLVFSEHWLNRSSVYYENFRKRLWKIHSVLSAITLLCCVNYAGGRWQIYFVSFVCICIKWYLWYALIRSHHQASKHIKIQYNMKANKVVFGHLH